MAVPNAVSADPPPNSATQVRASSQLAWYSRLCWRVCCYHNRANLPPVSHATAFVVLTFCVRCCTRPAGPVLLLCRRGRVVWARAGGGSLESVPFRRQERSRPNSVSLCPSLFGCFRWRGSGSGFAKCVETVPARVCVWPWSCDMAGLV
eukprot:2398896-Rhodomonas_salina.1